MAVDLITPKALRTALWRTCFHACLTRGGSILNKECVDFPGLVVSDAYDRKAGGRRTFFVAGDEREFDTVQAAARAWNEQRRSKAAGDTEGAARG